MNNQFEAIMRQMMSNNKAIKNPIVGNAMQMFQRGDVDGLNKLAENMCKEKGTTTDAVKQQIMRQFGIR